MCGEVRDANILDTRLVGCKPVSTLYHANEVSTDQPQSLQSHSLSEGSHGKAVRAQSSRVLMAALVECQYRDN
jgi:hypothetical protein